MNYRTDVAPIVNQALEMTQRLSSGMTGATGVFFSIATTGLRYVNDLIAAGVDPVAHIERIHAADPALASVESEWADALRKKFG